MRLEAGPEDIGNDFEVKVQTKGGDSMDERPDNFGPDRGVPRPDVPRCLTTFYHAFEDRERALGRRTAGSAAFAEHRLIVRAALPGKLKISDAHGVQPDSKTFFDIAVAGGFEGVGKFRESRLADGIQKFGFVGEMPVRRGSRDASPFPDFPQRQAVNTLFFYDLNALRDEDFTEVAVMVFDFHETIIAEIC